MSIRFFPLALLLCSVIQSACANNGFDSEDDDDFGSTVSAASRDNHFARDVDAVLAALDYRPCNARDGLCVLSALEPIEVLEVGDPHQPQIAPNLCTIADGKIESCEGPGSQYNCHEGLCWCYDGWDCIEMIFARPVDCAESYKQNPNSPGGSCYSQPTA